MGQASRQAGRYAGYPHTRMITEDEIRVMEGGIDV
jgi:hypothetical protein